MELGKPRQIKIEVRQRIVFAGICFRWHRCQIPEQVVNDEAPRQEVVDGEFFAKRPTRIDVAELIGLACVVEAGPHELPEFTSGGELPRRRRMKLIYDCRQIRISCLQVEREVMLGEGLNDAEVLHQEHSPRVIHLDGFTRPASFEKIERSECRFLAVSRKRLYFRVFKRVPDSAQFFVKPRRQKAGRDIPPEVIKICLYRHGAFNKLADGVRRGVRPQARQLLNFQNDILKFVLPSERKTEETDRMPRNHCHLGEQVRQPQRPTIAPFEKRQHGEKPNQLVGVGRVLENLTEKVGLLR